MKRINKLSKFAVPLLASLLVAAPAQATLILTLSDGTETETVEGIEGLGAVLFVGSVGDWDLNITTGVADPLIGEENVSRLSLSSINVTGRSSAGGTLVVSLTDTGNVEPVGDTHFSFSHGGTSDGTISFSSYVDTTNAEFGQETQLYETGNYTGDYSGSGWGGVSVSGPYSITTVATITHDRAFQVTGFNHVVSVPEPGSLALLGMGLLGVAFGVRVAGRRSTRRRGSTIGSDDPRPQG